MTEVLYWYDGPQLTALTLVDDASRVFLSIWSPGDDEEDQLRALVVEVSKDTLRLVTNNVLELHTAFTDLHLGDYYTAEVAGEGAVVELTPWLDEITEDHLPGDVTLYLKKET